jgi:hypothetical protein
MRMWNIPSALLCNQHLLAEHRELHILAGQLLSLKVTHPSKQLLGMQACQAIDLYNASPRHIHLVHELQARWQANFKNLTHDTPFATTGTLQLLTDTIRLYPKLPRILTREQGHAYGPVATATTNSSICPVVTAWTLKRRCVKCRSLQDKYHYRPIHPGNCLQSCEDRMQRDEILRPIDPTTNLAMKPKH